MGRKFSPKCPDKYMNFFLFERAFKLSERFPFGYHYPGYHVTTQLLLIKATAPPAGALRYFAQNGYVPLNAKGMVFMVLTRDFARGYNFNNVKCWRECSTVHLV